MPTTIVLSFPWGLYHATPWGRHVNEGAVEWPPSPWRILRGLYSVWQNRLPQLEGGAVESVLQQLVDPPEYILPSELVEAHKRHYLPDVKHRSADSGNTDKIIDAFGVMARGASVAATWPVDLDPAERGLLAQLVAALPYLGRSESVCEARLAADGEVFAGRTSRAQISGDPSSTGDLVRILVPTRPLDIGQLLALPKQVRKQRLPSPPGAYWQLYSIDDADLASGHQRSRRSTRIGDPPTAVRWALAEADRPSMHSALAITGVLRRACMSMVGDPPSPTLAGKDSLGTPLQGHRHAHYLALDEDGDFLIDHLVVWAPAGLETREIGALSRLTRLRAHEHLRDFRPAHLGIEAVASIGTAAKVLTGPSKRWTSCTPFIPPRHAKKGVPWESHLQRQVREELERRGWPDPQTVDILAGTWLSFRRHRVDQRLADARRAGGARITFSEPAGPGPLCLGGLSHFGLGLFLPD